jgi:hypothetical protein
MQELLQALEANTAAVRDNTRAVQARGGEPP